MVRRQSSSTAAVLASGEKLPVLVLRRTGDDATLLRTLLKPSMRIDMGTVGPEGLVRTPLRWPTDQRRMALALCVVVRDRPCTVEAVGQLVRQAGDVPVVAVVDDMSDASVPDGSVSRGSVPHGSISRGGASDGGERTAAGGLIDGLLEIGAADAVSVIGLSSQMLEHVIISAIDRRDRGLLHLGSEADVSLDHRQAQLA